MKPGEYLLDSDARPIEANANRKTHRVIVKNTGDRPIQVGSHYHFFETNASLSFDRAAAYGMRLEHRRRHGGAIRARRRERSGAHGVCRSPRDSRLSWTGGRRAR